MRVISPSCTRTLYTVLYPTFHINNLQLVRRRARQRCCGLCCWWRAIRTCRSASDERSSARSASGRPPMRTGRVSTTAKALSTRCSASRRSRLLLCTRFMARLSASLMLTLCCTQSAFRLGAFRSLIKAIVATARRMLSWSAIWRWRRDRLWLWISMGSIAIRLFGPIRSTSTRTPTSQSNPRSSRFYSVRAIIWRRSAGGSACVSANHSRVKSFCSSSLASCSTSLLCLHQINPFHQKISRALVSQERHCRFRFDLLEDNHVNIL